MVLRVQRVPGTKVAVRHDGTLRLVAAGASTEYSGDGVATAMWIASHRHGGDCGAAARTLAAAWDADPVLVRAGLETWAKELSRAGFLVIAS